nr:MAG TPA: hypothetical protein [Caudoviricetes sp.]
MVMCLVWYALRFATLPFLLFGLGYSLRSLSLRSKLR